VRRQSAELVGSPLIGVRHGCGKVMVEGLDVMMDNPRSQWQKHNGGAAGVVAGVVRNDLNWYDASCDN